MTLAFALVPPLTAHAAEPPTPNTPDKEAATPAAVDGFRSARFGMNEEQVRQSIQKDFPGAGGKLKPATHPIEKTTIFALTVPDLLPDSGTARLSYILGYRSKRLIQVNIAWTSERTEASDEAVVGTANGLREYFSAQAWKPDSVVTNRQIADNAMVVFRAADQEGRTVYLRLTGSAATAKNDKTPRPPPLTLELSYISDPLHPDVFKIAKGQF